MYVTANTHIRDRAQTKKPFSIYIFRTSCNHALERAYMHHVYSGLLRALSKVIHSIIFRFSNRGFGKVSSPIPKFPFLLEKAHLSDGFLISISTFPYF